MSAQEVLLEVAEKLPPDATLEDAIEALQLRRSVEDDEIPSPAWHKEILEQREGRIQSGQAKFYTIEEAREKFQNRKK